MISLTSLWIPILVSSVFVFIASSIMHVVLNYHGGDFAKLPGEDQAMDALRALNIPPGDYVMPWAESMKATGEQEYIDKATKGPVAVMVVQPNGPAKMGGSLAQWFTYSVIVGIIAAYVASRALGAGGDYLDVFRFVGVTAFACYVVAGWQNSIWYKMKWSSTIKNTFDGLVYALLTAGTFGWLWPS
ncbi:MAG: hypothetical protein BMS9Abin29_1743 [Gemmatimonadota bacterium]|nr:MAG: hypothetical protein BMS9Abin29_1743 [Gemmatimonadota bacterium]